MIQLFKNLCLDSAESLGQSTAYSQPVVVGAANAMQLEIIMVVQTATNILCEPQVSNDNEK